jgi:formaldehyde-activating enzyme involved in methanogenesis
MIRRSEKKIPVKGAPEPKPLKQKCSVCEKIRPIAKKSRKICSSCIKAEKREKQRAIITQEKLDQITSRLVRALYPSVCPHCRIPLDSSNSNCGHFVSRTKQPTRFSLKNLVAIDRNCNFYRPEHAYTLGKVLNELWGKDTADDQIVLGNRKVKFNNYDRSRIYDIYKAALAKVEGLTQEEKYDLLKETQALYEEIVNPLIF